MKTSFVIPHYYVSSNISVNFSVIAAIALVFNISKKYGTDTLNIKNKLMELSFTKHTVSNENMSLMCLDDFSEYEMILDWFKLHLSIKAVEGTLTSFEKSLKELILRYNNDPNALTTGGDFGLISSIPKVYTEAKEREYYDEVIDDIRASSDYVGIIKERTNLNLKLVSKRYVRDRQFWIVNALHDEKNLITYFDSKSDISSVKVSSNFKIRATIKRHEYSNFNKCKETQLTRVVYS